MKRISALFILIFGLISVTSTVHAQSKKVPHYFPDGIETLTDPADQFEAYRRYINAASICTEVTPGTFPRMFSNSVTLERTIKGKKVTFIFDPWVRTKDGRIVFYDFCGQHYITQEQLDVVVEDEIRQVTRAMDIKHEYYKDLAKRAEDSWVAAQKKAQPDRSEDELRALLNQKVPETPSITFRELNLLPPQIKESDSIPREIHVGYISALGEAWLHSGVVYTAIQARILDELHGSPDIMVHEFTHADPNLQTMLLGDGIDLELMASVQMMMFEWNKTDLFSHHYTADLREMLWVKFGYDFEQARDEIFMFPHDGNQRINRAKLNEHMQTLEKIKAACREFFRNTLIPEFYARPHYWTSMHDAMGDDKGVFRIMFALYFDSTLLGGHSETMRWCQTNEPLIKRAMYDAWQKRLRDVRAEDEKNVRDVSSAAIRQLEQRYKINRADALRLAQKYHITKEQLQQLPLPDAFQLIEDILVRERASKGEGTVP
jgi:hypothetical protein